MSLFLPPATGFFLFFFLCVFLNLSFATERYHHTLVRMAIIKNSTSNKYQRGCGEKGALLHCWWECKLVQPLQRTVGSFLRKLKLESPYDPAIPLLGIYPDKTNPKRYMHPYVHSSNSHNSQDMETHKCPLRDERIKKIWYLYTMDYYSAIKRMK